MSSRASAARCEAQTSGSWSSPRRTDAGEQLLAQRALVAVLDQPAHDRVEHRDRLQRGGRRAIGGMLVGLRRDLDEALVIGQRGRRTCSSKVVRSAAGPSAGSPAAARSRSRRSPRPCCRRARLASASSRTTFSVRSVGTLRTPASATRSTARRSGSIRSRSAASAARGRRARSWKLTITSAVPARPRASRTPSGSSPRAPRSPSGAPSSSTRCPGLMPELAAAAACRSSRRSRQRCRRYSLAEPGPLLAALDGGDR